MLASCLSLVRLVLYWKSFDDSAIWEQIAGLLQSKKVYKVAGINESTHLTFLLIIFLPFKMPVYETFDLT